MAKKKLSPFKALRAHARAGEWRAAEALATRLVKSGDMPTAHIRLDGLRDGRTTRKASKAYVRKACGYAH